MTDISGLWDFDDPSGSEKRFRDAADSVSGTDRAVLMTQVARALGLQQRYDEGHAVLDQVQEGEMSPDGRPSAAEVRTELERGRLFRSAGDTEAATARFERAALLAGEAGDLPLLIDAMHMQALVVPEASEAVRLNREALGLARSSQDPAVRRWEASLLNNLGCALVDAGALEEARDTFEEAVQVRRARGDRRETQIARWMVGWTLRLLGRTDEALEVQRALRAELEVDGAEDPYVDEELALLEAEEH